MAKKKYILKHMLCPICNRLTCLEIAVAQEPIALDLGGTDMHFPATAGMLTCTDCGWGSSISRVELILLVNTNNLASKIGYQKGRTSY